MRIAKTIRGVLAPRVQTRRPRATLAIWWGAEQISTVKSDAVGSAPLLFDGWPVLSVDEDDDAAVWERLLAAAELEGKQVRVAAAVPFSWGPARRTAWRRAAEALGITNVVLVPAAAVLAAAVGIAPDPGKVWAGVTLGERGTQVMIARTDQTGSEILAQQAASRGSSRGVPRLIVDALEAAGVPGPPSAIVIPGDPTSGKAVAAELAEVTDAEVLPVVTTTLASTVLALADRSTPRTVPDPPTSTSIVATISAGVLSLLLAGMVISDSTVGMAAAGRVALFSPAHLALSSAGLGLAVVAAAMLTVHWRLHRAGAWDWPSAGTWLLGGALGGAVVAGATGLVLASTRAVPAGPSVAWSLIPVVPYLATVAGIGLLLRYRPDPPPTRRIWPPMAATALAAFAVLLIRTMEPVFSGMPTSRAFVVRGGFVVLAAATAMAVAASLRIATLITVALAVVYVITASPSTGTVAALAFVAAVTIRAAASLIGIAAERRPRPKTTTSTSNAPVGPPPLATGH